MKIEHKIKTLRLRKEVISDIEDLARKENRTFTNMVDTILAKAAKYPDLVLNLK